jgi:hypothetical protein
VTLKEFQEAFKRWTFFPRTKIDYMTFRKLRALKSRDVGQESWFEWFKYITRNVALEPTLAERIQEGTYRTMQKKWMSNFADNLPYIRFGDQAALTYPADYTQKTIANLAIPEPVIEGEEDFEKTTPVLGFPVTYDDSKGIRVKYPPTRSAIVVGRGPSLFKHKHPELLATAIRNGEYNGLIVASDGALIPLLEAGIVPHVVTTVDGSPAIKKWFDHPLVEEHGNKIAWIASVTVDNSVYQTARKAGLQVYWFNPMFDDWHQIESFTRLQRLMSRTDKYIRGVPAANSGGCAGNCAWIMAVELFKCSPVCLIGMDAGYPEGTNLEETHYFKGALKEAGGDVNIIRKAYPVYYHPVFKTKSFADIIFNNYRNALIEAQQDTKLWYRLYGGTINATEGGTIWGEGIKCMPFKQFLTEHKT